MKRLLIAILCLSISPLLHSQEDDDQSFTVEISTDSVLLGNYLEVRFSAVNLKGQIELPRFEGFDIVSGPNQQSSMQMTNGAVTSSMSYSLLLRPQEVGTAYIAPAYIVGSTESYETTPIEITTHPNPDGIITESRLKDTQSMEFPRWFGGELPVKKKKKKLKETKI